MIFVCICLHESALAVGKERMGQDALTLVQLLGSIQREFFMAPRITVANNS